MAEGPKTGRTRRDGGKRAGGHEEEGWYPFRGSFIGKSNTRAPGDSPLALSAPNTLTCCRAREVDCGASPISADFVAGPCKAGTRPDAPILQWP